MAPGMNDSCGSCSNLLSSLLIFADEQSSNKHNQQPHIWDEFVWGVLQRSPVMSNQTVVYGVYKH